MTDQDAGGADDGGGPPPPPPPPPPPAGGRTRARVRNAPQPVPAAPDSRDPVRKWIAYLLIWLLIGIIAGSGLMLFAALKCHIDGAADVIFRWMGVALAPVAALAGAAVTFYMERGR
jgi:hypothetical protein